MKGFKVISFIILLVGSSYCIGQGNGNGGGNGTGPAGGGPPGPGGLPGQPCWPPPCVPIDGGISVLIVIGAAFGGKKAYDSLRTKD